MLTAGRWVGKWVAKLGGDGWLGREWVAKLVARLLATAALGLNLDISEKYKMGDISKGAANTL
jgi:hypothetical protein